MTLRPTAQAEVDRVVANALGMSEPGTPIRPTFDVNGRPPRIPAVGLHPGAIDGSIPHVQPRLDRWRKPS
jgi:hypothetical protein